MLASRHAVEMEEGRLCAQLPWKAKHGVGCVLEVSFKMKAPELPFPHQSQDDMCKKPTSDANWTLFK